MHGVEAARIVKAGHAGPVDILVTTERGLPLAISTADCLAITMYDQAAHALSVAHVGWRGTASGGAPATVRALAAAGGRPERVRVTIGPSIGPCCYEVDEPVVNRFRDAYPRDWERWMRPGRPAHWMLDLWQANEDLLGAAGVPPQMIENALARPVARALLLVSEGDPGRLMTIAAL